jgi:hypothetical protein
MQLAKRKISWKLVILNNKMEFEDLTINAWSNNRYIEPKS